jgi:hypothetical protein
LDPSAWSASGYHNVNHLRPLTTQLFDCEGGGPKLDAARSSRGLSHERIEVQTYGSPKGTPAEFIGYVEAPQAIKQFGINFENRRRNQ